MCVGVCDSVCVCVCVFLEVLGDLQPLSMPIIRPPSDQLRVI